MTDPRPHAGCLWWNAETGRFEHDDQLCRARPKNQAPEDEAKIRRTWLARFRPNR